MPSKTADPKVATTIHLNRSLLDRAEKLVPRFQKHPMAVFARGGFNRASILRLALDRGLAALEDDMEPKDG